MRVINHEKGIGLKISCLNVGDFIFFKSGSMAHKKGMATNQDLGKEVMGFVFDHDGLMVYVKMEDAIGWEIDWDKTIDANYQELKRRESEKFWAVINKAKEAIKKDKDMKFTRCQNVDCNKEYDFNDFIDVAVQAQKDGLINNIRIDSEDQYLSFVDEDKGLIGWNKNQITNCIEYLKELYIETFVIDNIGFPELKVGGKFIQNGIEWELDDERIEIIVNTPFFLLKGATVIQKRSL